MHSLTNKNDDLVERAADVLRTLSVPEGPDTCVVEATLAALRRAEVASPPRRALHKAAEIVRRYRIAAGLVLIVTAAVVVSLLFPRDSRIEPAAFGAVIEHIHDARTVQYRATCSGPQGAAQSFRFLAKGDRTRMEFNQGPIVIVDPASPQVLTLMPDQKKAFIAAKPSYAQDPGSQQIAGFYLFESFRSLQAEAGSFRGMRELDGRPVLEFQAEKSGLFFEILADPETGLPVRTTITLPLFEYSMTMSDFVFDAELDDGLFSLTPPSDYSVHEQPDDGMGTVAADPESAQMVVQSQVTIGDCDLSSPVEQDVIEYLSALAGQFGGEFPSVNDFLGPMNNLVRRAKPQARSATESERRQISEDLGRFFLKWQRAMGYLRSLGGVQPAYAGHGVQLGDGSQAVLGWPLPEGDAWRIVYGDLSTHDAAATSDEVQGLVNRMALQIKAQERAAGSAEPNPGAQQPESVEPIPDRQ